MFEGNPQTRVATVRQSTEPEDFAHSVIIIYVKIHMASLI